MFHEPSQLLKHKRKPTAKHLETKIFPHDTYSRGLSFAMYLKEEGMSSRIGLKSLLRIIFLFLRRAILFWRLHVSYEEDSFIHSQCRAGFTKLDHELLRWPLTCCLIQCSYMGFCCEHYKNFGGCWLVGVFCLMPEWCILGESPSSR